MQSVFNKYLFWVVYYKMIKFDYALVDRDLGSIHMFSLTSSLGKPISEKKLLRIQNEER